MSTLSVDGLTARSAAVVWIVLTAACGSAEHVGVLRGEPMPLFDRFRSYQTLDEIAPSLPDRSTWHIVFEDSSVAREGCPRFEQLTFSVEAVHHDIKGRLTLNLYNDRLATAAFAPADWPAYLAALARAGLHFDEKNEIRVPPATVIARFERNKYEAPSVGWTDTRFMKDVDAWVSRCS